MNLIKVLFAVCVLDAAFAVKPYFPVTENSELYVQEGEHIGLKCIPEGIPKPDITWHFPGTLSENSPIVQQHVRFHYDKVELEIINMTSALAGIYACLAHNRDGTASLTYNVMYGKVSPTTITQPVVQTSPLPITLRPNVYLKYTNQTVNEGDAILAIPCAADGLPKPTITWSGQRTSLPSNAEQYQNFLIIRNIRLDNDRSYVCAASNSVGISVKTVHIIVKPKPHIPPNVTLPPSMQGKYGETVTIDCNVTGYPTPTIKWYFNGGLSSILLSVLTNFSNDQSKCKFHDFGSIVYMITPEDFLEVNITESRMEFLQILHAALLPSHDTQYTIRNAQLTNIGAYACEATNDAGTNKATVVFTVQGTHPSLTATPPQTITVNPNSHPHFTCRADGDPKPSINWTFKPFVGTSDTSVKQLSADHTTLTLSNVKQSGLLACQAVNPFGQVQATTSIIYIPA